LLFFLARENEVNYNSNDKTPIHKGSTKPQMKITPPLCNCGRRCKRKKVINPGPNIDRVFYSCPINKDIRCQFFKWEAKVIEVKNCGDRNEDGARVRRPVPQLSIHAQSLKRKEQSLKSSELKFQSIKKRKDLVEACSELFNNS